MNVVHTGKRNIHIGNAIYNLGSIYKSPLQAFWELLANSIDASIDDKVTIWIAVFSDRVEITDNGNGMLPIMPDRDYNTLLTYFESTTLNSKGDIREKISDAAKHSLVWLADFISYSPKVQDGRHEYQGVRGIGFLAYQQYAKNVTIITKPSKVLVDELVNEGMRMPRGNSFMLTFPTVEPYAEWDSSSTIMSREEKLTDPFGNELSNGTKIILSNFDNPGLTTDKVGGLTPGRIKGLVSEKVDTDSCSVFVGNCIKYAENTRQAWERVLKEKVLGTPVYSATRALPDHATFNLSLYYDQIKTPNSPMVLRGKTPTFRLTDEPKLNHEPWTKLGGTVNFPGYVQDATLWDSSKSSLKATKQKEMWINSILEIERLVQQRLEEIENAYRERESEEFVSDVVDSMRLAMNQIELFRPQRVKGDVSKESAEKERRVREFPKPGIRAKVIDENGHGVFDVKVVVRDESGNDDYLYTNVNGRIDFGKYKPGTYTIRVIPDKNQPVRGRSEYTFEITNEVGYDAVFKLGVTAGTEARPRLSTRVFSPQWANLASDIPYEIDFDRGFVFINLAHYALNEALTNGDENLQMILISRYMSDVHALLLEVNDPIALLQIAANLNAVHYSILVTKRAERKSAAKSKKMKRNRRSV